MDTVIDPHSGERYDFTRAKWTWACRGLPDALADRYVLRHEDARPRVGDVAVVEVTRIGRHGRIDTDHGARLRLYAGDHLVCAFGHRYATDVYEGRVRDLKRLHLLSSSGVVGTAVARHRGVRRPTGLAFVGYLAGESGDRISTRERATTSAECGVGPRLILVVGTGMNTGKTTVTRKILHGLVAHGVRVAGCKITGTASPRDLFEMAATGAVHAMDFSEYGWPSTYGATPAELVQMLHGMLDTCARKGADVVVMEIADGFLQRETRMLLQSETVRALTSGLVLSAACSGSALAGAEHVTKAGFAPWAVTGLVTNSPLFMREFRSRSSIPIVPSTAGAHLLIKTVLAHIERIPAEVLARAVND
jgi:hypothetical protein